MLEKVLCPQCGARLIDAKKSQIAYTITMKSTGSEKSEPDYQIKCPRCKNLINMFIKNANARSLAR